MFYFIVGLLGVVLLYAHYAVPKRIFELKALKKDGTMTQAEVLEAKIIKRSRKAPNAKLQYRYTDYIGKVHEHYELNLPVKFVRELNVGDKIQIKYLPNKTNVSCLEGKEDSGLNSMYIALAVLLIFDIAIAYGVYSEVYAGK